MSRKRRAEPLHRALARRALDGAALCADGQPLLRSLPPARCVPVRADAARACLGVVMVGWSRDGDSLVSYSVEQTEASTPATRASLYAQWWRFTPGAPLERIGEVRLFRWMTAAVEPSAVRVDVLELADHWVFHGSFGGSGALERSEALTVAAKDGSEEPYDAAVEAHPPYLAPAVLFVPAPSDWPRGAGYLLWSVISVALLVLFLSPLAASLKDARDRSEVKINLTLLIDDHSSNLLEDVLCQLEAAKHGLLELLHARRIARYDAM